MELLKLAHCVYQCDYHIVLVTRHRRKKFTEGIFRYIEKKLVGITEYCLLIKIIKSNTVQSE